MLTCVNLQASEDLYYGLESYNRQLQNLRSLHEPSSGNALIVVSPWTDYNDSDSVS